MFAAAADVDMQKEEAFGSVHHNTSAAFGQAIACADSPSQAEKFSRLKILGKARPQGSHGSRTAPPPLTRILCRHGGIWYLIMMRFFLRRTSFSTISSSWRKGGSSTTDPARTWCPTSTASGGCDGQTLHFSLKSDPCLWQSQAQKCSR